MPRKATSTTPGTEPGASPPARKVVTRSPAHTVRAINLPHLQKTAIEADSSLERDFVYVCLGFPYVRSIVHQPFTLELAAGRYTPDFLVGFVDGSKAVVEVKPVSKIKRYKEKFTQAESKLATQSMRFVVAHDLLLKKHDLHERAKRIRRYAKGTYPLLEKALVISALQQASQGLSFEELINRGVQKVTLLHMVAHQQLQLGADLDISDGAIVHLPDQHCLGGSHAIRFASWLGA
ncbi:TnsA endonuclease N-terminal domain-containing protein [Acidovorax sp. Root219]|uniref:TnsA endonuclease N-terminal domain-containing protein n=1 Tax=Acidovorax sp. Root219 TaxID=1736493 RepID=UPI000B0836EC|nr:TnsA endonuclease N-terminal domain-containing protein [Acidovorax sp. Root219]